MSLNDMGRVRIFAFTLIILAFSFLVLSDIFSLSGDAGWMYMVEVSKHYDSWHTTKDWSSLLFIYETRCLNELLYVVFPHLDAWLKEISHNPDFGHTYVPRLVDSLHPFFAIQMIHAITLFLFGGVLCCWVKDLLMTHRYGVFIVICLACGLVLMKELQYFHFLKYLDSYFTYMLLSACIALRWLKKGDRINKKILIFIVLCIFHCICYRKNAICILPVFAFLSAYYYFPATRLRNVVLFATCASAILLGGGAALNATLPSQRSYPQSVMMFSTLKNVAILTGNHHILQEVREEAGVTFIKGEEPSAHVISPLHFAEGVYEMNEENWNRFSSLYVHYMQTYPMEFALERVAVIVQFYANGYLPMPVRRWISFLNPSGSVHADDSCWNHKEQSRYCSAVAYDKVCIYGVLLFLLAYAYIRKLDKESEWTMLGVVIGLVGLAYSLSFWIVTPTPDTRYHSFSVFAACMAISLLLPILKRDFTLQKR